MQHATSPQSTHPSSQRWAEAPSRLDTHSRGAWAHCRCFLPGRACCRRAGPSPGSSGSSGCCCRPGARAGQRCQHPGQRQPPTGPAPLTPAGRSPRTPPPLAHVPRGHCTSSHSLPFQRRRCFCTAPRSKSVVRRKLNCEHNGGDTWQSIRRPGFRP